MYSGFAGAIARADSAALFCHVNPDGDTLGSALGLCLAIEGMGKRCAVFCDGPLPECYAFLPWGQRYHTAPDGNAYALSIAVDVADAARMGALADFFAAAPDSACIDHHPTNPGFARASVVRPECAATAESVLCALDAMGAPLTREIALCLYVGVSTDTMNFSFNSVTGDTLRAAARMVDTGLLLDDITRRLYRSRSVPRTLLLGRTVASMRLFCGGEGVIMTSSWQERCSTGADESDYDGIINYGIEAQGVRLACLLRQMEDGRIKASFRSGEGCDVGALAKSLGGGGHAHAAGCTLTGLTLAEAEARVTGLACALLGRAV